MSAVSPKFGGNNLPISYTADSAIVGGQLVQRKTGARLVEPAGAASNRVCGVARNDVPVAAAHIGGTKVGDALNVTVVRQCVVPVTFVGAAVAGDKLIAAAAGKVEVAGAAPDARQVVGEAFENAADGETKLAYIY